MTAPRAHGVSLSRDSHVACLTFSNPPNNHLNVGLIGEIADLLSQLDTDDTCRSVVLASTGKVFCAGADFSSVRIQGGLPGTDSGEFYKHAMRLFDFTKPIVAAVQGAAVGAGVGLALAADFRVVSTATRFSVNFNRLGFHPGFGLSCTLPRLVGTQQASLLLFTGRRIDGAEALRIHLADELVDASDVLPRAHRLADEIASSAPLAVRSTRASLRDGLAGQVKSANQHELAMQSVQFASQDFQEGVRAMAERRMPFFVGR